MTRGGGRVGNESGVGAGGVLCEGAGRCTYTASISSDGLSSSTCGVF